MVDNIDFIFWASSYEAPYTGRDENQETAQPTNGASSDSGAEGGELMLTEMQEMELTMRI